MILMDGRMMKTTNEILKLVLEEGEGYHLEFKANVNSDLAKEMVAFANASGGRIFIGISDEGKIIGCDLSNNLVSQIQDIAITCDPPITINIEKLIDSSIIVIHVPESANRPHRCNKGFYLRIGANSQKMNTADITSFLQSEARVRFDEQLRTEIEWDQNIDDHRLKNALALAKITPWSDRETLLCNLGVGDYQNVKFYLNNAGIIFFGKEPTQRLYHASVVCALFKGITKTDILDRKEYHDSLIENINHALNYLRQHLNTRFEITGKSAQRKEILELPEVALREAIVNAVTHRDYHEKGAQVMIEIFDDRVEIYNPGGLPKGLPQDQFGKRSICRNPVIANLMLRFHYIEKMGTGIKRMQDAMLEAGCSEIKIDTFGIFTVVFPRNHQYAPSQYHIDTKSTPSQHQVDTKSALSQHQVDILENCSPANSIIALMTITHHKDRTRFRRLVLNPLIERGFVEMTIPQKPNSRFQKYLITDQGKAFLLLSK
jgi:ATP-dependent DNA helicase RecG